ncbi:molybdate ABC transporter, periplasmic molybdate-binding protein [Gottschalkia acidurici 9a]|uniref:Molybdate ABC transporter, periplasmic molybdate-binding protein n=1 Tax=Gottschalkia acidurici (strain ATCC 7906 / DSM 604 / BCRC 14475 / CIP 104303 / KCTC 5404 / NCIMB 10678 / 9a) TaxID=1128398 RepID=K0AZD4_GOTA9|nr:molybdate ABC transporter substrate-binding protein [Gottschalkia acidurici]AFS78065.1 molybdate ABC transporter, periplasmic molybdate-binding protein [Gottschalkia acidurici 9a]
MNLFKRSNVFKTFTLALVLSLFLVGCGDKKSNETDKNPVESSENENKENTKKTESLMVYCAGGLKAPMEDLAKEYEAKTGVKIETTYAHTGQLIAQAETSKKGDAIVLASDEDYTSANEKGLVNERHNLAYNIPVIAVPKGNPKGIKELKDLAQPGVKVLSGDLRNAPIGKISVKFFEKLGLDDEFKKNIVSTFPTINETVLHLGEKNGDAAIIWESNALQSEDKIDFISIPEDQNLIKLASITSLKSAKDSQAAEDFVNFVANEGKEILKKHKMKIADDK